MNFITSNKKYFYAIALFFAAGFVPHVAFAGEFFLTIGLFIFSFFTQIAGLCGVLLNLAINELVFEMGTKLQGNFGKSVEAAWSVIRDIINLSFIFGLVYIGFQVILKNTSQAQRLLPPLIIAALLINFSLFFTKAIIDVSNIAAVEIYKAALVPSISDVDAAGNPNPENDKNVGLSGAFMQLLGLKDNLSPSAGGSEERVEYETLLKEACGKVEDENKTTCSYRIMNYFLLSSIFMIVAAYAFLSGAILLVVRFITLVMLLIGSSLMFVGMALPIPGAQSYSSKWWSMFMSAAFMAPVYFLLMYIALAIASRVGVANPSVAMSQAGMSDYDHVEGILNLIIVCAFMLMAVSVAKSMSNNSAKIITTGSTMAMNKLGGAFRGAGRGALNTTKWAGRQTGAGAGLVGGAVTRNTLNLGGRRAAGAIERWQARTEQSNSGTLRGAFARYGGNAARAAARRAESATPLGGQNLSTREASNRAYTQQTNRTTEETTRTANLTGAIDQLDNAGATAAELTTAFSDLGAAIRRMTSEEIENLSDTQLTDSRVAVNFSDAQLTSLQASGRVSAGTIGNIRAARNAGFNQIASTGSVVPASHANAADPGFMAAQRRFVMSRSVQEAGNLPVDVFIQPGMTQYITPRVLEERMRNGGISNAQIPQLRSAIDIYLHDPTTPNNVVNSWRNWADRDGAQYVTQLGLTIP